jgi:putative oxidoreductase
LRGDVLAAIESKEPTLVFPGLAAFYASGSDLWYPLIRITVGGILLVHGLDKVIHVGLAHETAFMTKIGFISAAGFAVAVMINETIGAACLMLGLFTRIAAAAVAIEMAFIAFGYKMPHGFYSMEYTLMWGLIAFALALRGGGPCSLDRAIGKEN